MNIHTYSHVTECKKSMFCAELYRRRIELLHSQNNVSFSAITKVKRICGNFLLKQMTMGHKFASSEFLRFRKKLKYSKRFQGA